MSVKISTILLSMLMIVACSSNVKESERLGTCIIDGGVDDCRLSTIENGHK